MSNIKTTRRELLAGAGSLVLAFEIPGMSQALAQQAAPAAPGAAPAAPAAPQPPALPGSLRTNPKVGSWLKIEAEGRVHLLVGKVELGQGILTAVAQLCADELEIDMKRLKITSGDTRLGPNEGTTAGSFSMPDCGTAVRAVSADARKILLDLASQKLGVDAAQLTINDGTIRAPDGKQTTYWELVTGQEFAVDATGKAPLKPASARKYVGKSVTRLDIPPKATGGQIWIQDLRPAGMVHGRVVRPPQYDAKLISVDTAAVEKLPGVLKVVRDGRFLGVIAEREEQAIAAAAEMRKLSKWELPKEAPSSDTINEWLLSQKTKDIVIKDQAKPATLTAAATIEATYRRPFVMHATIGPSTAIGTLGEDGTMTIQTHSQSVFETGAAIAQMLGVDKAKVHMQHHQGSACYGHNGADDVAADAALLARALPGKPVRIQWSRNDEHKWEPYNSAMVIKTKAEVDQKGDIVNWDLQLWSTAHGTRPGNIAGNLLPARHLEKPFAMPVPVNGGPPNYSADRNAIALYDFPGHKVTTHFIETFAARVSSTRGLGAYSNVFAIESFIDELAMRAKADPLAFRLKHLKDERGRAVLEKAAEAFGWNKWEKKPGRGRGIAFARYKNLAAFTAIALEVDVNAATGKVRVIRAVAANDSGDVVSPDGVKNQIEGGLIQSLSWTMKEGVRYDASGVRSEDWTSYPILTFTEVPPVEVVLVDRPGTPFLGTGEASQGPTSAALANAVFDAVGVRVRDLPLTPARVKALLNA